MNNIKTFIVKLLMLMSLFITGVIYGIYSEQQQNTVAHLASEAANVRTTLFSDPWYYRQTSATQTITQHDAIAVSASLVRLSHFTADKGLAVSVINNSGDIIHQWSLDWFQLWPEPEHLSYFRKPKSKPGTMIHGSQLLPNGDLVFNFEYLGMVKVDACGKLMWKLPINAHHSIDLDDDGNLWVPVNINHHNHAADQSPQLHTPYYTEPFIYKISPEGEILEKISVIALLEKNGFHGALYLSSLHNKKPSIAGDTLHLNDIEVFPSTLAEGKYAPGDIMISLRNINTVIVFDGQTWEIKDYFAHQTVRPHDPDFIDGNTLAIFDNNNRFVSEDKKAFSRIVTYDAINKQVKTFFQGSEQQPFFTATLGTQQWLDNGNVLITHNQAGSIFEIDANGNIVWEYVNLVKTHTAATITEAERLPETLTTTFFEDIQQQCQIQ